MSIGDHKSRFKNASLQYLSEMVYEILPWQPPCIIKIFLERLSCILTSPAQLDLSQVVLTVASPCKEGGLVDARGKGLITIRHG